MVLQACRKRPTYHERVIGGVGSRPELGPPTPQNWPDLRPPEGGDLDFGEAGRTLSIHAAEAGESS